MDQDFEIKGGKLLKYVGPGGDVASRRASRGLPRARSGTAAV